MAPEGSVRMGAPGERNVAWPFRLTPPLFEPIDPEEVEVTSRRVPLGPKFWSAAKVAMVGAKAMAGIETVLET